MVLATNLSNYYSIYSCQHVTYGCQIYGQTINSYKNKRTLLRSVYILSQTKTSLIRYCGAVAERLRNRSCDQKVPSSFWHMC